MNRLTHTVHAWLQDMQDRIDDDPIMSGVLMLFACGCLSAAFVGYLFWGRSW
ncbi:hypothetical protein [Pseudosulfitobacter pseudonitzschiae]|uniref:hypothetical protein n=1 Tax=Pseudosulfitobacter pseudonitzschiae TaxID=1402135 RepID=UPI001AF24112|nr:hypothetical protein [Pseudosulfitobacter pseudonitzschiae]MBM1814537.1 hypothetical protein [Pseudosulfitobacter pseudonitzschiae]MBM1831531.1 hypothetical protein [Pseudosulfitobacter pseudonitzschiae]MBM1836397.1 hypothetical protein [Pseudosulfitobacter pseudonitzschiae]MBM1841243.1 hypothetical protein [Pseudosulfitobacter pseudonitzschiae]MBM1846111.1 hypothetical protein [Pseudosulfitobacter pseudonitzschiae]